eukprot:6188523-Pleurochrysis_carterae.AAC.2
MHAHMRVHVHAHMRVYARTHARATHTQVATVHARAQAVAHSLPVPGLVRSLYALTQGAADGTASRFPGKGHQDVDTEPADVQTCDSGRDSAAAQHNQHHRCCAKHA